jgi:hypothetical protein
MLCSFATKSKELQEEEMRTYQPNSPKEEAKGLRAARLRCVDCNGFYQPMLVV